MGECLVKDISNGIPVGIFRPGIGKLLSTSPKLQLIFFFNKTVVSTYKEPVSGWIDNLYGPTGIAVGTVSGLLRVSLCDESKIADVVPVDTCISGLIAAAWDTSAQNFDRFLAF